MLRYVKLRTGRALALSASVAALTLAGCASLPVSGPTGKAVVRDITDPATNAQFRYVPVTDVAALPAPLAPPPIEEFTDIAPPTDLIGPGDVLQITVFEAGVSLFASGQRGAAASIPNTTLEGAAQATNLPPARVDDEGYIRLPYAGRMRAAGQTPAQLQAAIRAALRGMSQNPQVNVRIEQSVTNSAIIGGEVARAGRLVLTTNRETLSQALALVGGYRGDAKDLTVRVKRQGRQVEYRLSDVMSSPSRDMRVLPGDHIEVVRQPLTFSVMGAPGRVELMPFAAPTVSLTEAIAMAGGANPNLGDAKAIFVFRTERLPDGTEKPVVYHVNMMQAGAFFLAQRFEMRDKDILYVGNAAANQPSKLVQILSQLFSPVLAIQSGLVNSGVIN